MIIGKYTTVSVAQWCIRALASRQCGPRSNPVVDAIGWVCCWFSPSLQDIFLRVLRCSSVLKNQHFQIPIRPGIRYLYVKNHYVDVLPLNRYLFITPYYFNYDYFCRRQYNNCFIIYICYTCMPNRQVAWAARKVTASAEKFA